MNQEKIGKFIYLCRKDKKLTQEGLASKLNISDRAVSKWERGLNLPDASLMIDLCNILGMFRIFCWRLIRQKLFFEGRLSRLW